MISFAYRVVTRVEYRTVRVRSWPNLNKEKKLPNLVVQLGQKYVEYLSHVVSSNRNSILQ